MLLLLACTPQMTDAASVAATPSVQFVSPTDDTTFDPLIPVTLCALVTDRDTALGALTLTLLSDHDGALTATRSTCAEESIGFTALLSDAEQTLTLYATDPGLRTGHATLHLSPTPNQLPQCEITATADTVALTVQMTGHDEQALDATLISSRDGGLWAGTLDPDVALTLPLPSNGAHLLSLSVTDPRGAVGSCVTEVVVQGCMDADADGVTTCAGDCDDTRTEVGPEQAEAPDGLDNDCDGAIDEGTVLVDDDGDGVTEVAGDCNDADATIYPGATEIADDGVDQDCDDTEWYTDTGDSAPLMVDADNDGHGSLDSGGDDCDDTDPGVRPGIYDLPYDGVDADCDGVDPDDLDGDGADHTTDCNDGDPSVGPGVAEVWYDGTDQDCDGNDADQDGDGATASSVGGDDCDDADAALSPSAAEVCGDGIDNNCDGLGCGFSGEIPLTDADLIWTGVDSIDGAGAAVAAAGDVNGDGYGDILIGAEYADGDDLLTGTASLFYGPLSGTSLSDADATILGTTTASRTGATLLGLGDVDGDGYDDVLIGAPDDGSYGTAALFYGPISDATFETASIHFSSWTGTPTAADLDDNGSADLLLTNTEMGYGRVFICYAPFTSDGSSSTYDVTISATSSSYDFGVAATPIPDIDGDGLPDIAASAVSNVGGRSYLYLYYSLLPAELAPGDADISLYSEELGDEFGAALAAVNDVDGDGYGGLLVGAPDNDYSGSDAGVTYLWQGPYTSGSSAPAQARFYGEQADARAGARLAVAGDVDGDDVEELLIGADTHPTLSDLSGAIHVFPANAEGSYDLSDAPATFYGTSTEAGAGRGMGGAGDTDGDGWDELLFGAPDSDAGAAYLFLGSGAW